MSNLEWVETGNTWLDLVLFSIAPIVIHVAVPDALNFSLGTLAFGVIFSASIPLYRKWGDMVRQRLRANGVSLYYRVRNAYETVIRFEKEVRCCELRAALRCATLFSALLQGFLRPFPDIYTDQVVDKILNTVLTLTRSLNDGRSRRGREELPTCIAAHH